MSEFWAQAAAMVWGPVTVALLMGTGIYLSFRLKFTHLRHFRLGWRFAAQGTAVPARTQEVGSPPPGDISPWQSMMTMLAGAIGNGNIAGVATAIAIGGPGAVFWMWASGLFAMATKYSEAVLGLKFREQLSDGSVAGGPMYYLRNGVRSPMLAWIFAFLAGMAGMTTGPLAQTNSMALVLNTEFHIPKWLTGAGITIGTPEKINPLWYSSWLPVFFFLSAVSVGLGMTIVESNVSSRLIKRELESDLLAGLGKAATVVIGIYLVVKFADIILRGAIGYAFTPGFHAAIFWIEILIGFAIPMILMAFKRFRASPRLVFLSGSLIVGGVVFNRLNSSILGTWQYVSGGTPYVPTLPEVTITVALVSLGVVAFGLVAKFLPLFQHEEHATA